MMFDGEEFSDGSAESVLCAVCALVMAEEAKARLWSQVVDEFEMASVA
jgi:hypothetical protein